MGLHGYDGSAQMVAHDLHLNGGLKHTLSDMWLHGTAESVWEGQASQDHAAPKHRR